MTQKNEISNGVNLSIIIVNWNTRNLLEKCLISIYEKPQNFDFEVFVVDNASSDKSVEMVKTGFPQVKLIANKENTGFAKANNQAIKQAQGEFVLLLNPDTEILNDSLEKTVSFMRSHAEVGIAGCRILNSDHSVQPSVRKFPDLWSQIIILLKLHRLFPKLISHYLISDFDYSKTQEVEQVMGAFFMIRKEIFKKIGLLDENFYIWFEEVDFCKRVKDHGEKNYYLSDAEIIHHQGQSFKQILSLQKQKAFNRSLKLYFKKHRPTAEYSIISIFSIFSLPLAYLVQILKKKNK